MIEEPIRLSKAGQIIRQNARSPLSEQIKLQRAQQEALALFTRYKDDLKGMLRYLQDTYGIEVMDGNEHPWVDQKLESFHADGMLMKPYSLVYAGQVLKHPEKFPSAEAQAYDDYQEKYGVVTIFLKSDTLQKDKDVVFKDKDVVFHEVFHLFQSLHGLELSGADDVDTRQISQNESQKRFIEVADKVIYETNPIKIIWGTFTLALKIDCYQILDWFRPKDAKGMGNAMRGNIRREMEAYQFLAKHGEQFGLEKSDIRANRFMSRLYKTAYRYSHKPVSAPPKQA